MKAFIFSTFFCAIPVFSRSLGSIFENELDSRLVGALSDGMLSATFVHHDGKNCVFLKGLCDELRQEYKDLSIFDSRLDDICRPKSDDAAHCQKLLDSAMPEALSLHKELEEYTEFSYEDCRRLLTLCNFFSGVFPILAPFCHDLKLTCYYEGREEAAVTVLVRTAGEHLRTHDECYNKMEGICHRYSGAAPEFKGLCVDLTKLCRGFVERTRTTCKFLEKEIQSALSKNELSETICDLAHLCLDYGRNCNHKTQDLCKKLDITCTSKGYFSTQVLGGSHRVTDDFQVLFEKYGIYIGRPDRNQENPWDPSLSLLLQNSRQFPTNEACQHATWNPLPLFGDPDLFPFYNPEESHLADKICLGLESRFKGRSGYLSKLKEELGSMGFIENFGGPNDLLDMFSHHLTTKECTETQAKCYFYSVFGDKDIRHGCDKLSLACYTTTWNKAILKGVLGTAYQRVSGTTELNSLNCQKHLAEKCKGLQYPDVSVTFACLHLGDTCKAYTNDLWEDI